MQLNGTVYKPLKWGVVLAVFLSGLLVAGCDRGPQSPPPRPAPEVATVTVQPQKVMLTTELPGRTAAFRVAEIRPQVSGLVRKRLFTEGSDVKAGQTLYQIDPAPFQAALRSATANLAVMRESADQVRAALKASSARVAQQRATLGLARTNRQRFEDAFKDKVVSTSRRDQAVTDATVAEATLGAAEAKLESDKEAVAVADAAIHRAEAAVETARIHLGYCRVLAPVTGRIGKSDVTEGAIVTAYQPIPLAVIQQLDPIYVDVPQSTTELLRMKRRMEDGHLNHNGSSQNKVKLNLEDGTAYPLEGTLQFRDVTVDPTTGSVILRVVVPNPKGDLLPGMFVRAVIKEGLDEQAILVPQQGVARNHRGDPFALIVDDKSQAAFRPLTLDRTMGDKWLVSAGLTPGDRVIVKGLMMLRPGTKVNAVPFKEPQDNHEPVAGPGAQPQKRKEGGV